MHNIWSTAPHALYLHNSLVSPLFTQLLWISRFHHWKVRNIKLFLGLVSEFMMSRYKSHNHFRRIIRYKYWLFLNKALFLVQMYRNIDLYFSHTFSLHAWLLGQCSLILAKAMLDNLIELYPHLFILYSQLQIGYRWN